MNELTAQFVWWQGVVEDRDDPLLIGRCRVRILGYHTDDKNEIPTKSLPWAYPAMPINTKPNSTPIGPNEGTWVMGFFRDGRDCQEPVMTHVIDSGFTTKNDPEKGFNDPEENLSDRPFGKVPLDDGEINTNRLGRGDTKDTWVQQNQRRTEYETQYKTSSQGNPGWSEPDTKSGGDYEYSAKFPYNYVEESESGHVFEVDDTPGKERLSKRHRSGSFEEMHSDGSVMTKVVRNNYEVILGEDNIYVTGSVNITSDAHVNIKSAKTIRIQSDNQIRFKSGSAITFDAVGGIQFKGAFVSTAEGVPFMHGAGSPFVSPFGVPLLMDNQIGVSEIGDLATTITDKVADNISGTTGAVVGELSSLTGAVFSTTIPFVFPKLPPLFNPLAMSYAHMAQALYTQISNFGLMSLDMTSLLMTLRKATGIDINLANPIIPFPSLRMIPILSDYSSISLQDLQAMAQSTEDMKSTVAMAMTLAKNAKLTASAAAIRLAKKYTTTQLMNTLLDTDWKKISDLIKGSTDVEIEDVYEEVEKLASSDGFIISNLSGSFEKGEYIVIVNVTPPTIIGTVIRHSDKDILFTPKIGVFGTGGGRLNLSDLIGYIIKGTTSGATANVGAISRIEGVVKDEYRSIVDRSEGIEYDREGHLIEFSDIANIKNKDDLIALLIRWWGADWKAFFELELDDVNVDDIISRVGSTAAGGISDLEKLGQEVLILTGNYDQYKLTENNIKTMELHVHGGDFEMWVGWLPTGSLISVYEGIHRKSDRGWKNNVFSSAKRSHSYTAEELMRRQSDGIYTSLIGDLLFEHVVTDDGFFQQNMSSYLEESYLVDVKYFVVSVGSPTDIAKDSRDQYITFEVTDQMVDIELKLQDFDDLNQGLPIADVVWFVIAIGKDRYDLNIWKTGFPFGEPHEG